MLADADSQIVVPTTEDVDAIRGFRIVKWGKPPMSFDNYECTRCQFSTLWPTKMSKHQAEDNHVWAYPGQNPRAPGDPGKDVEPEY